MKTRDFQTKLVLTVLLVAQLVLGIKGQPIAHELGMEVMFDIVSRGFSGAVYFFCLLYWWKAPLFRLLSKYQDEK